MKNQSGSNLLKTVKLGTRVAIKNRGKGELSSAEVTHRSNSICLPQPRM